MAARDKLSAMITTARVREKPKEQLPLEAEGGGLVLEERARIGPVDSGLLPPHGTLRP
jgi:hypothetical protein